MTAQVTSHSLTSFSQLQLNNVCISPDLIKNLISVRALTRYIPFPVEFDPYFGFSIKDLGKKMVLLRCDLSGDLYPLHPPAPRHQKLHNNLHASHDTELWHSWLGHPSDASLRRILCSIGYFCSKSDKHSLHACHLGKHVRFLSLNLRTLVLFPSNCYIVMCGHHLYQATLDFNLPCYT